LAFNNDTPPLVTGPHKKPTNHDLMQSWPERQPDPALCEDEDDDWRPPSQCTESKLGIYPPCTPAARGVFYTEHVQFIQEITQKHTANTPNDPTPNPMQPINSPTTKAAHTQTITQIYALLEELRTLTLCLLQLVKPPTTCTTPPGNTQDHPTYPTMSDHTLRIHQTLLSHLTRNGKLLHCQLTKLRHNPCPPATPWSIPTFTSQTSSFLALNHTVPHLKHVHFKTGTSHPDDLRPP